MPGITVAVFDRGARAHALSLLYERDPDVSRIIVAPGNGFIGYKRDKEVILASCDLMDSQSITNVVAKFNPDLVDIAQDDAVATDAADRLRLRAEGRMVFAPGQAAAQIESDKEWAWNLADRHGIRMPYSRAFSYASRQHARQYLEEFYTEDPGRICFVKAAGLAAGKGSLKARSKTEAYARVEQMRAYGLAGERFLIQNGAQGREYSLFAISDGEIYCPFRPAEDYKLHLPYDTGDQTGSMGAETPIVGWDDDVFRRAHEECIGKPLVAMRIEGVPYRAGILYCGGMMVDGDPTVIEWNARWGDPDGSAVLLGITAPYSRLVAAACTGKLAQFIASYRVIEDYSCRVAVVGAARGYPGDYSSVRGKRIYGLDKAMATPGVTVLGAGIAMPEDGVFYADGGRLFCMIGKGRTIASARARAYGAMSHVYIEGNNLHWRHDIAWHGMEDHYALL